MKRLEEVEGYTRAKCLSASNQFLDENPDWEADGSPYQDLNKGVWVRSFRRVRGLTEQNGDVRLKEPKRK